MYSLPLNLLLRFYILSLAFVSVILICLGVTFINESLCGFLKFFFMWLFEILESVCFTSFEKFLILKRAQKSCTESVFLTMKASPLIFLLDQKTQLIPENKALQNYFD